MKHLVKIIRLFLFIEASMSGISFRWEKPEGKRSVGRSRRTWKDINPLTSNDPYRGRTAPLTSKRCILYIYSTNIGTEYFKRGIYSSVFPLQNAVCFIILTYLVSVLLHFIYRAC